MVRGKLPPPEHNNIHFIENYKYNQLRVSLNEYLENENFPQKRIFRLFSKFNTKLAITQPKMCFLKN